MQSLSLSGGDRRMNIIRKKGSDSDRSSAGVREKEMAKSNAVANLSQKGDEIETAPVKVVKGSSRASSVFSRMDDGEKDVLRSDSDVSLMVADTLHSRRSSPRNGHNPFDSDPYVALRIADITPRSSGLGNSYPYMSLRIAHSPPVSSKYSTVGNDGPSTNPYLPLKIAASRSHVDNGDGIIYDANDSSGSDEGADKSDGSIFEQVNNEEDSSKSGRDSDSEDDDQDFSTNQARISLVGSASDQGKDNRESSGYARVSVAGSAAGFGKNVGRDFPGYARVSIAGSEADYAENGEEEVPGYARILVAGSEIDYGNDVYANVSRAESEGDYGKYVDARGFLAGSEIDHGQDIYARLSVSGSVAGRGGDRDFAGFAKVSVTGSEVNHGKDVDARVSVAGSQAEYGKDRDRDSSGYERPMVVQSIADHIVVDMGGFASECLKNGFGGPFKKEQDFLVRGSQNRESHESCNKEYDTYLELNPETRAKLQYRVRVILISPQFELKGQRLSAFSDIYKSKFGEDVKMTGFSSTASLCYAMPNVIQRKHLETNGLLVLVDSSRNRRAVSGIRSGLRRIVYDVLMSFHGQCTRPQFEVKCSELLGKPLVEVMVEHGYDTPNVESLLKDLLDIAGFEEGTIESRIYLCSGAEDPALTDGLLVNRNVIVTMNTRKTIESKEEISKLEDTWEIAEDSGQFSIQRESLIIGSSVPLRSLKNERRLFGSFSLTSALLVEDEILQVRLRMQILLAFHNSGRGVEVRELPELYAKMYGRSLKLQEFGFNTLMELARYLPDIFLLQKPKPGWVCLVPSQANRRILNTLQTGLRSSVFSVLVETYPEGLNPLDFLYRLQQGMSGELWEVLDMAGYICSDVENPDDVLSSSCSSDFQLVDFEEICVLLNDMMDLVRLGSNEDGSVVVKLRNAVVPIVDLLDCKMEDPDVGSFDELFVNLMMIAVDVTETSGADDGSSENGGVINEGDVQSPVKSFDGSGGLRSGHSPSPDLRLKHELRLILGSPEYFESGLAWGELNKVYRDRTGQELGSKSRVKSLVRAMPDVVCKDSLVGDSAHLSKTPKNLRILSATRAGLRQVLFWALVKNPGGIWANLLEGWFTDFAGMSLAATLHIYGYEMSRSRPFFPVDVFLRDMSDLLQTKNAPFEIYRWADEVKDPIHKDADLLGLSELLIQYNCLRGELDKVLNKEADLVEKVDESALKEDEGHREADMVNDGSLEKFPLKEDIGTVEVGLGDKSGLKTSMKEGKSDREANLDHQHIHQALLKEEASVEEIYDVDSEARDDLRSEEIENSVGDHKVHLVSDEGPVERARERGNNGKIVEEFMKEDIIREQDPADSESDGGLDRGDNEESAKDDEKLLPQGTDEGGWQVQGDLSESNSKAYAQLRVAGKVPKLNLDEWQFTDSDSDSEEEEEEEEDLAKKQVQHQLPVAYVGLKVKEAGKENNRAWVLPNNGAPWN